MSVRTGRYVVRRGGVVVPASAQWTLGPAIDSANVQGADADVTWHDAAGITAVDVDYAQDNPDGDDVTIDWVDDEGTVRVFTGYVDQSAGESLAATTSRLADGTLALTRSLRFNPIAYTMPPNPELADAGGLRRRVGLFGCWFTHQAMTTAGFDPGVPMHWSSVLYLSMCGSIHTVPDKEHAWGYLGQVRQAYRLSNSSLAPNFPQGDTQRCAADVFGFYVTAAPRPGTESLPWQVTWDMGTRVVDPTYGSEGEILLRSIAPGSTGSGLAIEWTTTQVIVRRHNANDTRVTLGTYPRGTNARFSVVAAPSGSNVILRGDVSGDIATGLTLGTTLPTGANGLCSVRITSPGMIGPVAVTRGDRTYMTTDQPQGRIYRHSMTALSLPGMPYVPPAEAGALLTDQARAEVGMRAQPLWQWIDGDGVLVNTDFETLATAEPAHVFDTRPGDGLALEKLAWQTNPGTAFNSVEVTHTRTSIRLTQRPALNLAEGRAETLENGDEYEVFLHPRTGEFWLDPDVRPLHAGYPYPSPPFPSINAVALNVAVGSFVGGSVTDGDGNRRGWMRPERFGWTIEPGTGVVRGAMEMLDPDTVLVSGTISGLGSGEVGSTAPDAGSEGLWDRREHQDFPQLRGPGRGTMRTHTVTMDIGGVDSRHGPYRHDTGLWVQSHTAASRVASVLHDAITNPTPVRTAQVEATGRVRPGEKVTLIERRPDGLVIEEDVVVARLSGSTMPAADAMTLTGIVTRRLETQTDPNGPEPGDGGSWELPPPDVDPVDPPGTDPPPWEGDPDPVDPPVVLPGKPSTPMVAAGGRGITVTWDGLLAAGGSAVGADYGYTEVAIERGVNPPTTIAGSMYFKDVWQFTYPLFTFSGTWHCRIRTVDLWGQPGPWSDVATITDVQGGNLLDNPETTVGMGGWGGREPVELTGPIFGSHPTGGNGVLRGEGDGTNHPFGVNRWIPCEEGEVFDLSGWVRRRSAVTGAGDVRISVVTRGSNAAPAIWTGATIQASTLPLGKWVRLSGQVTIPAGYSEIRYEWWLMSDVTSGSFDATACSMVSRGI